MTRYAIRDEYAPRFGRQVLTLWSGAFASDYEGEALELPGHNGFMVTMRDGRKVRVECETPRNDDNYQRVDAALNRYVTAGNLAAKVAAVRERLVAEGLDPEDYHCLGIARDFIGGRLEWADALVMNKFIGEGQ